jgi:hypothetical protein
MTTETPEAAQTRLDELKADTAWMKSYLDGDHGKRDEMQRLYAAAYPEPAGDSESANLPAGEAIGTERSGESAAEAPIAEPPVGAWDYEFSMFKHATDEHLAYETGIKEALFKAELPPYVANVARMVIARNIKEEIYDNGPRIDAGKVACEAKLEQRHGPQGAKQIIADASKVFRRLDAASLDIGDLLANSGAMVDPDFIETLARVERDYYAKRGK